MIKTYLRGGVALAAMTLALELAAPTEAAAQSVLNAPPPTRYTVDERGVDVRLGSFNRSTTDVVIGQPGQGGLTYERTFAGSGWRDNLTTTIMNQGGQIVVSAGGYSEAFTSSGSSYTPVIPRGSRLVNNGSGYTWTWSDGTVVEFDDNQGRYNPAGTVLGFASSLHRPNGEEIAYTYQIVQLESPPFGNAVRLVGVSNNFGYGLKVEYAFSLDPASPEQLALWGQVYKVTGYNFATEYCAPDAISCSFSNAWPHATYGQSATASSVTDTLGNVTNYTYSSGRMTGVKLPGSTLNDLTIIYTSGRVSAVNVGGGSDVWDYAYSDASGTRTTTITDPLNHDWVARSNISAGTLTSWADPLGNTTSYGYNSGRLSSITLPEGNSVSYVYDGRGNVTQTTATPKSGSGQSPIVTSAVYPTSCSNPITCNLPTSTTDGRNETTTYAWNSTHGGLTSVTLPIPGTGTVHPKTTISYGLRTAHYKDASGNIVNAPSSVYLPTIVAQCITLASCDGTADETELTLSYGSSTSTNPNNLLPTTITNRAGNGDVSSTITVSYDRNGDPTQINGPVSGMTQRNRYDAGRRQIGMVGPDPDGSGPLTYRAVRYGYNERGQVTSTEAGTVAGYGDGAWDNFAPLQQVATQYDGIGRPVSTRLRVGSTTYSSAQTVYDAAGRVQCSITRMTSLNTVLTACSPGSGSAGYDRVTRMTYDNANRVLTQTRAYGTSDAATETFTWTDNGNILTAKDGANNLSTFEYDGFDRLSRLRYPNASGGGSSTTDDEIYAYDANSNLTSWTNRNGSVFAFTYDALNRRTLQNPTGTSLDVTYTYDNLNRLLTAVGNGRTITRTYDQLSRLLSETTPQGQMSYQYDEAGNRTQIEWPDDFAVNYAYDLYSEVTDVEVQGTTPTLLATYSYDNLGRRASVTRPALPNTNYTYTGPRLTGLTHNLSGTSHDVTLGFQYNPAGQITQRTVSNDNYVWDEATAGTTSYTNNGRNQVTNAGGSTVTYDTNANINAIGSTAYAYDALNRMTTGSGQTMTYDPANRLNAAGGSAYGYVGSQIAAVYSGGALAERYVPGPGVDETVAYYGSGTQRMVFADERGSTMGYTTTSGTAVIFNTYDEYGVPGSSNGYGMQYTGQFSLPNAGGYYYKSRSYNPNLGRFMQPDTIGYKGGMNIYAYVYGDPMNRTDPLGMEGESIVGDVFITQDRCPRGVQCFGGVDLIGVRPNYPWPRLPQADGGGGGVAELDDVIVVARRREPETCDSPMSSLVGSARAVLEVAATGADIATVGLAAGGVTGGVAIGTKLLGYTFEGALWGINLYDAFVNGNSGPLTAQLASLPTRLIPGGRALQGGLRAARGPTGILRNSAGQFRTSYINHTAVREAGDQLSSQLAESAVDAIVCPEKE